jgi:biotin synthase
LEASGSSQEELHARAFWAGRERFGSKVFVRGVVEVSNFCRENCHYCGMRRDNRQLERYRVDLNILADLLLHRRPEIMTDINIQAGEDPVAVREVVLPLVKLLRRETSLGVSVCVGTLAPDLTRELQAAGATMYIIKFELADATRYAELEAPGTFEERVNHIRWLAEQGWNVSSGFIAGLPGQDLGASLQNLELASQLPLRGCSVSPFVSGEATPLAGASGGELDLTLNCMAALRLMRPDWLIPAVSALNLAGGENGYRRGLRAGANLCTINLTPEAYRDNYLLYKRDRFLMSTRRVTEALVAEGLTPTTTSLAEHFECAKAT